VTVRYARRTVIGVVLAACVLAFVAALGVEMRGDHGLTGRLPSFSTTSCPNPHLTGAVVAVTLTDHGGGMMGSVPMTSSLRSEPATVDAGNISFVAHSRGSLAHEHGPEAAARWRN